MSHPVKHEAVKGCSCSDQVNKFNFFMKARMMKEHLSLPPSPASSIFYQLNHVNKTMRLPVHHPKQSNDQRLDMKPGKYPRRKGKCFPESGPMCCTPMIHRTKQSLRPQSPNDVQLPTHEMLRERYTLKVDKKFLRKD